MKIRIFFSIVLAFFSHGLFADAWLNNLKIVEVAVKYGSGCIKLEGGEVVKFDLTADDGRAEYALVLAVYSQGKTLDVYQTDDPLIGGCDTGTTVKPHSMIRVREY